MSASERSSADAAATVGARAGGDGDAVRTQSVRSRGIFRGVRQGLQRVRRSTVARFVFANNPWFNTVLPVWRRHRVNLHWWSVASWAGGKENFGDALSPFICEALLRERGLSFDTPVRKTRRLYAVGSILDNAFRTGTVWGSGLQRGGHYSWVRSALSRLDVRLVRGPLTRDVLLRFGKRCPAVFGDPAVLLPELYVPKPSASAGEVLVLLHFSSRMSHPGSVSALTADPLALVDRIAGARLVVSSSLHGIIVAESFGVPAVLLMDNYSRDLFKYRDWYLSTGREVFPVAHSVAEALELVPAPLPDLGVMRERVRGAFPFDLWGASGEAA